MRKNHGSIGLNPFDELGQSTSTSAHPRQQGPYKAHGATHPGRRTHNEDAFLMLPHVGLFAVADGMGGHEGGEVASAIVVDTLRHCFDPGPNAVSAADRGPKGAENRMTHALERAHQETRRQQCGRLHNMGSTVATILVGSSQVLIAHVGDSRVYRLRGEKLDRLTVDHSIKTGFNPKYESLFARNVITRAIGSRHNAKPDLKRCILQPGDRFLLCSDGLNDVIANTHMERILIESSRREAPDRLVQEAYLHGGVDNITAIVVDC